MAMLEPTSSTTGLPPSSQLQQEKIILLSSAGQDTATFSIKDEDHTVGNALRFMLMKNPQVVFCGYSVPHPSEYKVHLRIQTDGTISAIDALSKGLDDLNELCSGIKTEFIQAKHKYTEHCQ